MFRSQHIWLALIFIVYSFFIIIRSALDTNGFITSDSAHYLQLATNFLEGNGMTTTDLVPGKSAYFATWPAGYPAFIALTSLLTGLGVFWASKLVNILFIGFALILISLLFKERAPVVAMVLFVSTFSEIFTYTWSEVPFLVGMLWIVYSMTRFIETGKNKYAVHMLLASLLLFFMRYIGLIGAGMVGLIGFYYLFRKDWKRMVTCWFAGGIPLLIAGIYLVINKMHTGEFTGMERIPRKEDTAEFIEMTWDGLVREFNLLATGDNYLTMSIILLVMALVLFIRPRQIVSLFSASKGQWVLPGMFFFAGIVYFAGIVAMRWSAFFDPLNFRLLGPATFMIWLAFLSLVSQSEQRNWIHWRRFLVTVLSAAFIMNIAYSTYTLAVDDSPTYLETVKEIKNKYEVIPTGSIVAMEDIHARYLRPEMQYIKLHFRPYFAEKESVEQFVARVTPNHAAGVFLKVGPLLPSQHDKDLVDTMEQARKEGKAFIRIE